MPETQPIPAVAYYRVSTDQQDGSIEQQQAHLVPRCKLEGIDLQAEFVDDAISGDKTAKRKDFQDMLRYCQARASEGRPIAAIVCWDAARFSRATSVETNFYIHQFQQAGVHRVFTLAGRWIDFRREEDRVLFNLVQDMTNHRYLRDLSRSIVRGQINSAKAGYFSGGMPPYGFDRLLLNDKGEVVRRLRRGERLTFKQRGWKTKLIPSEDAEQIEVVQWLYRTFDTTDTNFFALAKDLNRKGIPGPSSFSKTCPGVAAWGSRAVKKILTNPHYRGDARWGHVAEGRYFRLLDGGIQDAAGRVRSELNPEPVYVPGAHTGIVDAQEWQRVQVKILARKKEGRTPRERGYLLTGILHCGHCGGRMHGDGGSWTAPNGKTYTYRRYICRTHVVFGPEACRHYSMREDRLVPFLVRRIQQDYLAPQRLEELRQELLRQVEAKSQDSPEKAERLRHRIGEMNAEIELATRNVLRARDNLDLLQEALTNLRQQRARLQKELDVVEREQSIPLEQAAEMVQKAIERLHLLDQRLRDADQTQLREVLRQMVSRIDLYFEETTERKKREWYRFARGLVKLRPQLEFEVSGASVPRPEVS